MFLAVVPAIHDYFAGLAYPPLADGADTYRFAVWMVVALQELLLDECAPLLKRVCSEVPRVSLPWLRIERCLGRRGHERLYFRPDAPWPLPVSWQIFVSGVVLGMTIAAPPGPVNATAAQQASRSWLSSWLVLFGATTADGIFFILTYYGLTSFIVSDEAKEALFLVGGALMLYLAYATLRNARRPLESRRRRNGYPYLLGLSIGISNPFQLAWWVSVGIGMISTFGLSIVVGFFSGIVAWTLIFATLLHVSITRYERAYQVVVYLSGVILAGFGVWFVLAAIHGL
jgi:threonine/homoserine/homoserine lactone efflux protein